MAKTFYFYYLLLIISLCTFFSEITYANQQDSLLLLIEQTSDDNKKVDLFNELAQLYVDTAFVKSQAYADSAYQLAIDNKYLSGKALSLYNKSNSLVMNNQFQNSLEFIEKAIIVIEQIPDAKKMQAKFMVLRGLINDKLSKYYTAIVDYNEAYEIYDSLQDDRGKSSTLLNIGLIHHKVGDKETALLYYIKAKEANERLGRKKGLVYCYNNIGFLYEEKEDYKAALAEYEKGLKLTEETKQVRMKALLLENIGVSYMKLGQLDKALVNLNKGHTINLQVKDEIGLAYSGLYIAKIQFLQAQSTTKLSDVKDSYNIGVKFQEIELQQLSAESLTEMYTSVGMFEDALKQSILATQLQDSIASQDIQLKIKSLEIKKQFDNKQKEVELEKKEALFKTSTAHQTKIRNILLICMSLLLFGGFLLYRTYTTTLAVKEQLLVKNEYLIKTEEQLLLKNSSLKKTEERLAQNNKDLQKHIDLNVELEQFAYIASHDIKAPLRTIASFTSILKRKFYEQAVEREKTCFDFVEKSANSLNLLVDDLLEFSKSNTKTVNIEQLEFKQLLKEVTQNLDFSITQVNGTITTTNCDFSLHADQIKIKQILQNILSNALKFKAADRAPIINIAAREEDGFFFISIKDNGIGIAEEHFKEVFEKFARLNSQSKFEGSGLGLSICAKYIKKHKGKIWIERNEDVGVTFIFTIKKDLPLSKQALSANEVRKAIAEGGSYAKPKLGSINVQ